MKLGTNLNKMCKEKGLSISSLAREAGVPVQTVHAWTTGRKSINPVQIRAVAEVLEVSIYELLFSKLDPFSEVAENSLEEIFKGDLRVTVHRVIKK